MFNIQKRLERPEGYRGETPVVFLTFNRPDLSRRVFERIRLARPRRLYFVSDGPRLQREEDAALVAATRAIADEVDWPCEVIRDFAPGNLGCRDRVCSGIDHAFECDESVIILEDDCLPDPSFFGFCEQLLRRYLDEPKVMHIGGDNFLWGRVKLQGSYYFSKYAHIWGWASWRRAWRLRDMECSAWLPDRRLAVVTDYLENEVEAGFWEGVFGTLMPGARTLNTWDYPWMLSIWAHQGKCISPSRNLVRNLGFREDATHTDKYHAPLDLPAERISFPLYHPSERNINVVADRVTFDVWCLWKEPRLWKARINQLRIQVGSLRNRLGWWSNRQQTDVVDAGKGV